MATTEFATALDRAEEIELHTVGRTSGRQSSRPVWFVRQGETLYLLPVSGSESNWYRNMLSTPQLHLVAEGAECDVMGRPITDPKKVEQVINDFRAKYGATDVAAYYHDPDVAAEASLA